MCVCVFGGVVVTTWGVVVSVVLDCLFSRLKVKCVRGPR